MDKDKKSTIVVSDEMAKVFEEHLACAELRDSALGSCLFGYRRAKRAAKESVATRVKFWEMVRQVYPELSKKHMSYSYSTKEITVLD